MSRPEEFSVALERFSPEEWIQAGLSELNKAKEAFATRQGATAAVALKRAAGMALNGALRVVYREDWGRTYVAHVAAVATDPMAPEAVRRAAKTLMDFEPPRSGFALLRVPSDDERLLEAARTVMAHAYAIVHGRAGRMAE